MQEHKIIADPTAYITIAAMIILYNQRIIYAAMIILEKT